MKVLIVDDSPDALAIAKARLAKELLDLLVAGGGLEGLETARREHPDLILLDVDMPDMTGFDVCRAIKSDADLCMTPIIFLSGSTDASAKVKGLDLGAVDYVTKPFDAFELRARVRAALRTKHLQDLLMRYASVDPLTELPNRRALLDRMEQQWAHIQRHGGSLAFIMADLDHFKKINDAFGHSAGDRLLMCAATTILSQGRETDVTGRYGGEEFAILATGETAEGAAALAERCRQAVEKSEVVIEGKSVQITASFGVADSNGADSPQAIIDLADQALYEAKAAGRNRVHVAVAGQAAVHAATPPRKPPAAVSGSHS